MINDLIFVARGFQILEYKFVIAVMIPILFLNQVHAWFLKIDPVRIVGMRACMCVCVRPRGY